MAFYCDFDRLIFSVIPKKEKMKAHVYLKLLLFLSLISIRFVCISQDLPGKLYFKRALGKDSICLPFLPKMTESFFNKGVKGELLTGAGQGNKNIAIYLNDDDLERIRKTENGFYENYIIVLTNEGFEGIEISKTIINYLDSINFAGYISKGLYKKNASKFTLDSLNSYLIDHYFVADISPCFITINKFKQTNIEFIFLCATVFYEIKGHFLAFSWYQKLDDENSLNILKSNVLEFHQQLNRLNKNGKLGSFNLLKEKNLADAMKIYNEALVLSNIGNYADAIILYGKAIELYPDEDRIKKSEAFFNRAVNKRFINDLIGAIDDYSFAINLRPDYYKAYHNRGVVKFIKGEVNNSINDFTFVINNDFSEIEVIASAYSNRGLAKKSLGMDSCSDFKKAYELGGDKYSLNLKNCQR